jgi:hypothetical protein
MYPHVVAQECPASNQNFTTDRALLKCNNEIKRGGNNTYGKQEGRDNVVLKDMELIYNLIKTINFFIVTNNRSKYIVNFSF